MKKTWKNNIGYYKFDKSSMEMTMAMLDLLFSRLPRSKLSQVNEKKVKTIK